MKTIITVFVLLGLTGHASLWAQSSGTSKGQAGASPVNKTRKANSGLTEGKGVPYSKEKSKNPRPGSDKPIPQSKVGTESDRSATNSGKITPGSHNAQRDWKAGVNATKAKRPSTGNQ